MPTADFAQLLASNDPATLQRMAKMASDHAQGMCGLDHVCHLLDQIKSDLDALTPRVAWSVGGTYTITAANADEQFAIPGTTRLLTLRAVNNGSISNNIQGWFSTGQAVTGFAERGRAYDAIANKATGFPMQPNSEYTLMLHDSAGAIHVASSVASTVIVWGAAGYEEA